MPATAGAYIYAMLPATRLHPVLILAASVAVLGTAFAFQYLGGLDPCPLCIYQRYPYGVAIVLVALALALARPPLLAWLFGISALVFFAGGAIAVFHVGVEQHWWQGTAACTGTVPDGASLAEILAKARSAPAPRCDEIPWSFLGVSMAGYNVLASVVLGVASLGAMRRAGTQRI